MCDLWAAIAVVDAFESISDVANFDVLIFLSPLVLDGF